MSAASREMEVYALARELLLIEFGRGSEFGQKQMAGAAYSLATLFVEEGEQRAEAARHAEELRKQGTP